MRRLFTTVLLFALSALAATGYAQTVTNYAVTGTLTGNGKAIEAASVFLLKQKDSSVVKIALSGKEGAFIIENVAAANYLVAVEAVGFNKFYSNAFTVAGNFTAPAIVLVAAEQAVNGVTVTTKKAFIEQKIDKTVINVDASPTSTGLNALELLEKSPGVTIDNNNNISLKGKQGIIILIDGKQTYLSGEDLANFLKNMSAAQLDQIEIMSQPSAKYDAAGNSGIINIKTKKSKTAGFNGSISTSAIVANYFKNTNNINLNYRKNKLNLFANYSYSRWDGFNELNLERSSRQGRSNNFDRYSTQETWSRYSSRPHNFKVGADLYATKKTTIGAAVTGNFQNNTSFSRSKADIFDSLHNYVQYNQAVSQNKSDFGNLGFNVNFQHKIDTLGTELTADVDYNTYSIDGDQYSNNYLYSPDNVLIDTKNPGNPNPYLLKGLLPSDIDIFTFKSDFHKPFKKEFVFEAGIKTSIVKTNNDAQYTMYDALIEDGKGGWKNDTSRSNHFIYKENINAAYVNLQKQIKKWGIQVGLRAEQTVADGKQVTQQTSFHRNYTKLFPTSYISYKANDKNTWGLSYGRRIERPDYESLNPFQQQLDRYTYQQGNPYLQPQFAQNVEFSYNYKGQLNLSANYTATTDIINDVLITKKLPGDSNYTTFVTNQNIASNRNVGFSASYNKQLVKWWTISLFGNIYNNHFKGVLDGEELSMGYTAFNSNISNQFTFSKGWSAELSGWYNSKQLVSSAMLAKPMGAFSLGAGKQVLKSKGSVRLSIRDPFWLAKFRATNDVNNGVTVINNKWDNRRFTLTFTYRFGKTNGQQPRRRNNASEEEQNRVKSGGQQ